MAVVRGLFTSDDWLRSIRNSFVVAIFSTILATVLGTIAALGLSSRYMPYRSLVMAVLISPMIVPLIISAAAMFFFYSKIELAQTFVGVVLAHTALGIPFVVITVTATLTGFDHTLTRASASLGANPHAHLLPCDPAAGDAGRGVRRPLRLHHQL